MDEVEEVKRRIDIVDLISSYLTLKKAGANYRAMCPFHNEKTPSMMISPEKQIFKCFGCFLKGTEIITDKGIKEIQEIKREDLVFTHRARFQPVVVKFERQYRGEILQISTRQTNETISLTPDHKLFAVKTKKCKQKGRTTRLCQFRCKQNCPSKYFLDYKLEKIEAKNAEIGDYLLYPINRQVDNLTEINLYSYQKYLATRKVRNGFPVYQIPEKIKIDADLLHFLGYWIAEGSVYPRGIRFSLGNHEKALALEIQKLTKKLFGLETGIHYRQKSKSGIEVSISNSFLPNILTDFCGKGAKNKKIPDFCLKLPTDQQEALLNAIFKGDGTTARGYRKTRPGRKSITTISNLLALQIKNILLRIGIKPVITYLSEHKDKKSVNHQRAWTVSWMPDIKSHYSETKKISGCDYLLTPIKSIKKVKFNGPVYNLMVKTDHSYVVKNFAVGNCNEGGDVFSFVMKMENLEFREALEMLAERAGVTLKRRRPLSSDEKPDKKSRLFKINAVSSQVFHKILTSHSVGKSALEYLKKRKLSDQTIKDFMIGYAPSQKILTLFLKKRGFTEQEIANAGGPDRFYKRIVFPIRDVMGNVLGFTGRVIDPKQEPKYLNTPETIIFQKRRILYNLEKARGEIKLQKATIVVEGQMDVIASYQAGVKNVVATSGTALTTDHLQILYRYTPNIIFAFDSDTAGLITAKKAYESAIAEGFNVKMVELGEFKDPGEMIAQNPELWKKAVNESKSVIDWYFNLAFSKQLTANGNKELTSVEKKEIAKEILPIIKKIPDTIEQGHFIGLLAKKLDVNEDIVFSALEKVKEKEQNPKKENQTSHSIENKDDLLIGLLVKKPAKIKDFADQIKDIKGPNQNIYTFILNWYNNGSKGKLQDYLKKHLKSEEYSRAELLVFQAENQFPDISDDIFRDFHTHFQKEKNENLKDYYAKEIGLAEKSGDRAKLKKLIEEFQNAISK